MHAGGLGDAESAELRADWELLVSFLPTRWKDLAVETGALQGLRKHKSAEQLLRVLWLHLGAGRSLLATAARARHAGWAELSSVALWKRLRKSQQWLQALCLELFEVQAVDAAGGQGAWPDGFLVAGALQLAAAVVGV